MTEQESENRREVLNLAVRHKNRNETAKDVVISAKLYLTFLQDSEDLV